MVVLTVLTASMRKSRPDLQRSVSAPGLELLTPDGQAPMLALSVTTVAAAHAVTVDVRHEAIQLHIRIGQRRNAAGLRTRSRRQGQAHKRAATPILKERAGRVRDGLWS
jgi:hypothetical protein